MRYLLLVAVIVSTGCIPPRTKPTTAPAEPEPTIRANSFTVSHEWRTNELTAKRDYLHQWVRIVGKVEVVKADGEVVLNGDGMFGAVACHFTDKAGLADLHPGEFVVIDGYGTAKNAFHKCKLVKAGFRTYDEAWAASK
jgi:hypothetical protein